MLSTFYYLAVNKSTMWTKLENLFFLLYCQNGTLCAGRMQPLNSLNCRFTQAYVVKFSVNLVWTDSRDNWEKFYIVFYSVNITLHNIFISYKLATYCLWIFTQKNNKSIFSKKLEYQKQNFHTSMQIPMDKKMQCTFCAPIP